MTAQEPSRCEYVAAFWPDDLGRCVGIKGHSGMHDTRQQEPSREQRLREIRKTAGYFTPSTVGDDFSYLLAEVERLEAALREYGQHPGRCIVHEWPVKCTCGLSAALNGESA